MSGYEAFSATPGDNVSIDGASATDIAENNLPKTINNAMRALVAEFAKLRDLIGGAKVSVGTANAQTLSSGLSLAAYQQGVLIGFEAGATNTGATTLDVDAIGAKSVKLVDGLDLPAGAITAGGIYFIAYESDADVLLLLNPTPGVGSLANLVDDTAPQLGGDLDLNGNAIDFPSTPNISDVLDEDDLTSDSVTALATQQSIKAYVDASVASTENVQDIVGAMVSGNTEAGLAVTYQDADGTLDFEVDGVLQDLDALGPNSADGEFLVGTGAGALGWESGATVRASLGLGTSDAVQFGNATVASFTSTGIDDNTSGERIEIGDAAVLLGDGATAGEIYHIGMRGLATAELHISADTTADLGGNLQLFGSAHASQAGDIVFREDTSTTLQWDASTVRWEAKQPFLFENCLWILERGSALADFAGYGQFWVQNNTPNNPMFTDDAGSDFQIATLTGTETLTNKTLGGASLSGELYASDNLITRALLKDYGEEVSALGSGGGTRTFNIANANVFTVTVSTSANTFAFSNPTGSGDCCSITLIVTNGGSQTVNWPAGVDWAGGGAPSLTASGVDVVTLFTLDAGTTWYGFAAGLDMQ